MTGGSLERDSQFGCNLFGAVTFRNQHQDFLFPVRQRLRRRFVLNMIRFIVPSHTDIISLNSVV